jgi:MFS family permease
MPTDGTLFLENLPHSKQYLLTLLSVFFSLGAVLSSVVSYFFLPGSSCREFEGCDIAGKANDGWRRVLFVLGLIVSSRIIPMMSVKVLMKMVVESSMFIR